MCCTVPHGASSVALPLGTLDSETQASMAPWPAVVNYPSATDERLVVRFRPERTGPRADPEAFPVLIHLAGFGFQRSHHEPGQPVPALPGAANVCRLGRGGRDTRRVC